jgi:plastocyanin
MRKWRGLFALVLALSLVAAACGGDDDDDEATGGGGEAQTFPVKMDANTDEFATTWIRFFPSALKAHPGDTITFTHEFTGEIHSVGAGTLIEEGLEAFRSGDPEAEPTPEVQAVIDKIPFIFLEEADATKENPFNQAASQPCFLAEDDPPTKDACPDDAQEQPDTFTGTERFYSSGYFGDQETFEVELDDSIEPGTYTFMCMLHVMCMLHGPDMTTEVEVVDAATAIPSAEEVEAAAEKEVADLEAKVKPIADEILDSTSAKASGGTFPEGEEFEEAGNAGVNVFPREIAIKAGDTVTWTLNGFHTVAFDAPEDARPAWGFVDGVFDINRKAVEPVASAPIEVPAELESGEGSDEEGPPPSVKLDGGTYDGSGFKNSGQYLGNANVILEYTVAFPKAGTYTYLCLIHPDMEGTVKVA